MNLSQRQNEILRILKEKKYLSVEELSSALSVSKVTIRSDLTALEEKGAVTRTHGGVMIAEVAPRIVSNSLSEHEAEKKSIGKTAAALIPDDAVIIIDSGSTTVRIAEFLSDKNLTVVTNEVFSGGADYDAESLRYMHALADLNRWLAMRADLAVEIVCGLPNVLKGELP